MSFIHLHDNVEHLVRLSFSKNRECFKRGMSHVDVNPGVLSFHVVFALP
jgi:hypothetical protein